MPRMQEQMSEPIYRNKKWLQRKYVDRGLSSREIARECGASKSTILNWLKKHKINPRSLSDAHKYRDTYREKSFSSEPPKDLSYIVGVLLGDGWIKENQGNYTVGLISNNKAFNKSFYKALRNVDLNPSTHKNREDYWETTAYSKPFFEWWSRISTRRIWHLVSEKKELKQELIRGFYESEGTLAKHRVRMYNSDKKILCFIQRILSDLQFKASITKGGVYILNVLGGKKEKRRFLREIKPTIKEG